MKFASVYRAFVARAYSVLLPNYEDQVAQSEQTQVKSNSTILFSKRKGEESENAKNSPISKRFSALMFWGLERCKALSENNVNQAKQVIFTRKSRLIIQNMDAEVTRYLIL
jgi:hypothetical protein